MENEKRIPACEAVMDELDLSPLAELAAPFRSHIAGCRACANYERVSRHLAASAAKEPDVDRWNGFLSSLDRFTVKDKAFGLIRVLSGAIAAAVIAVVLTVSLVVKNSGMITADKGNIVASNGTYMAPVSDYDPETTDLNYYYEISYKN